MASKIRKPKIAVISTVHDTYDTRIFYKQILSLRKNFEIIYFSAFLGKPEYEWIIPLRKSHSKIGRIATHISLIKQLTRFKADLYLLHDPELLPLGIILKIFARKVIWDMHEDTYNDIKTKTYIKPFLRSSLAFVYQIFQNVSYKFFDGFILAEDGYRNHFKNLEKTCIVHNYPLLDKLNQHQESIKEPGTIVYIGSISINRGIYQLLDLIVNLKMKIKTIKLILIGPFVNQALETNVRQYIQANKIEKNVQIHGQVKNIEAYPILAKCMLGLALLLPEPNFTKSLPTKMFEYMALGLPVVVSNFPLWESIIADSQAGAAVDPYDLNTISEVIYKILTDNNYHTELSLNAKNAAQKYSWETESTALQNFLRGVIQKP